MLIKKARGYFYFISIIVSIREFRTLRICGYQSTKLQRSRMWMKVRFQCWYECVNASFIGAERSLWMAVSHERRYLRVDTCERFNDPRIFSFTFFHNHVFITVPFIQPITRIISTQIAIFKCFCINIFFYYSYFIIDRNVLCLLRISICGKLNIIHFLLIIILKFYIKYFY